MPSKPNYEVNREKPIMNNVDPIGEGGVGGRIGIPIRDKENELRSDLRLRKSISDRAINKLNIPEGEFPLFISFCKSQHIFTLYRRDKILGLISFFLGNIKIS
jgi:hypothetical protein